MRFVSSGEIEAGKQYLVKQDSIIYPQYKDLIDFTNGRVNLNLSPDISGDKIIKFKLYLGSDSFFSAYDVAPIFSLINTNDRSDEFHLEIGYPGNLIFAHEIVVTNYKSIVISGYENKILEFEITKSTGSIDQIKINEVITPTVLNGGYGIFISGSGIRSLENFSIYDIQVFEGSTLKHYWPGNGMYKDNWIDEVTGSIGTPSGSFSSFQIQEDITYLPGSIFTGNADFQTFSGSGIVLKQSTDYPRRFSRIIESTLVPDLIDEVDSNTTYLGFAMTGVKATSEERFLIKKLTKSGTVTKTEYAEGSKVWDKVWDQRTQYEYRFV